MAAYKVDWDETAKTDLKEIYWYFATQALVPAAAAKLVKNIRKEANALDYSPHYRVIDEIPKYRKKFVGKYVIVFTINEDKKLVRIKRIFDGRLARRAT
jgi:plasmid stabilization system protein ParE